MVDSQFRRSQIRNGAIPEAQDEDGTGGGGGGGQKSQMGKAYKRTTLTQQVHQLYKNNLTFKQDVTSIFQKIISTFLNWELFGDRELIDATRAFHHLASNFHFSCFSDEAVIASIMKTVESKKTPIPLKATIVNTFLVILKNLNFKKYFLGLQPIGMIQHIIDLAMEGA